MILRPSSFDLDDAMAILDDFRKYMEGALTDDEARCLAVTRDMLWNLATDPDAMP
jgi:hypothetical protein